MYLLFMHVYKEIKENKVRKYKKHIKINERPNK